MELLADRFERDDLLFDNLIQRGRFWVAVCPAGLWLTTRPAGQSSKNKPSP